MNCRPERVNVLLKTLQMMYISWGLRKKFWFTWAKGGVFRLKMSFFWPFTGQNKRIRYPFIELFQCTLKDASNDVYNLGFEKTVLKDMGKKRCFWVKMRFFVLLGVKMEESDTHWSSFFNVLLKTLQMMYITRHLRKKFWCTWAKRGVFGSKMCFFCL